VVWQAIETIGPCLKMKTVLLKFTQEFVEPCGHWRIFGKGSTDKMDAPICGTEGVKVTTIILGEGDMPREFTTLDNAEPVFPKTKHFIDVAVPSD